MTKLLLIDDEARNFAGMFDQALRPLGFDLICEADPKSAAETIRNRVPDVILLDLHFPGDDQRKDGRTRGGDLLCKIRRDFPRIPVVVFTARLSDESIPLEKFEYQPHGRFEKDRINKMQEAKEDWAAVLAQTLIRAIDQVGKEGQQLNLDEQMGFVVGTTPVMRQVANQIEVVARTPLLVMIYGERGTGKEGVAKAIHKLSGRKGELKCVNCSGMEEETLHSQIFGHERGAFTGASTRRRGLFELSEDGTLFLDEIQEMPMVLQNKLMRVVQDKVISRMGSEDDFKVNVRLIVASNRLLDDLVANRRLRSDLAGRFKQFQINLPSLRERMEDLPALWDHFVKEANEDFKTAVSATLRPEVLRILQEYNWPDNIRELESVIRVAVVKASAINSTVVLPENVQIASVNPQTTNVGMEEMRSTTSDVEKPVLGGASATQAAEIAKLIDQKPPCERYDYLTDNYHGTARREILIEIIRLLRRRQGKKVSHQDLVDFLSETDGGKSEKAKLDYDRIRRMVYQAGIRLLKLEANQ